MAEELLPEMEEKKKEFNNKIDELEAKLKELSEKFKEFTKTVEGHYWALPWFTEDDINKQIAKISGELKKITDRVEYILGHHVPIFATIEQSMAWITRVMKQLSNNVSKVASDAHPNLAHWSGGAALAYRQLRIQQHDALVSTVQMAKSISEWLFEFTKAGVSYLVRLVGYLVDLIAKLAAAIIDAGTVIGAPGAVNKCTGAIADFVANAVKEITKLAEALMEDIGRWRKVRELLDDHSKFPDGRWPQVVGNAATRSA